MASSLRQQLLTAHSHVVIIFVHTLKVFGDFSDGFFRLSLYVAYLLEEQTTVGVSKEIFLPNIVLDLNQMVFEECVWQEKLTEHEGAVR